MRYLNVFTKTTVGKNDKTRKQYYKIGIIKVTKNRGWFMQLYHAPDVEYQIFASDNEQLPVIEA